MFKAFHSIHFLTFTAINATSVIDSERVVYHISVVANKQKQRLLQLVILDRSEYNELSSKLMEYLRRSNLNNIHQRESHQPPSDQSA